MTGAVVTRFAPSSTGLLHLGHAHAALFAWVCARGAGGRFLLRIEDIDRARCRPEFTEAILEDLAWLGLDWDGPARRQSQHFDCYRGALDRLEAAGLIYPCFCTRAAIQAEIAGAGAAPHGSEGPLYPGTCRALTAAERAARWAGAKRKPRREPPGKVDPALAERVRIACERATGFRPRVTATRVEIPISDEHELAELAEALERSSPEGFGA